MNYDTLKPLVPATAGVTGIEVVGEVLQGTTPIIQLAIQVIIGVVSLIRVIKGGKPFTNPFKKKNND